MAIKDTVMALQATGKIPQPTEEEKRRINWGNVLRGIGIGMSGFAAPMLGNFNWQPPQLAKKSEAEMMFDVFMADKIAKSGIIGGQPTTVGGTGAETQTTGAVTPKAEEVANTRVSTPSSMDFLYGASQEPTAQDIFYKKEFGIDTPNMFNIDLKRKLYGRDLEQQQDLGFYQQKLEIDRKYKELDANVEAFTKANYDLYGDVAKSSIISEGNLKNISRNAYDLSGMLVDAYKEGGAGNWVKAAKTKLAARGLMGERQAEKYAKSSAIPGKITEIILRMIPMETQQLGKEGSVRVVESMFKKLGEDLPDIERAPKLSREQLLSTIKSMARVEQGLTDVDFEQLKKLNLSDKKDQDKFATVMANAAKNIKFTDKETAAFDALTGVIFEELDNFIQQRDSYKKEFDYYKIKYKGRSNKEILRAMKKQGIVEDWYNGE